MTGVMTRGRLRPNRGDPAMTLAHLKTLAGIHPPGRVRRRHVIRPLENAGPTGGYGRFDPAFRPGAQTVSRSMHGTADHIPCVHHVIPFIDRHRKGILLRVRTPVTAGDDLAHKAGLDDLNLEGSKKVYDPELLVKLVGEKNEFLCILLHTYQYGQD